MLRKSDLNLLFLLKMFFVPVLYELVIGGGGHFLERGSVTVRMLFFLLAMLLSFAYYMNKKVVRKDVFYLISFFTFTCVLSSFMGYMNNASIGAIAEDLKTLSFFYILIFFSLVVKSIDDIKRVSKIIKIGSMVMGIIYIGIVILLLTGRIDFASFYTKQNDIGEVMFRNKVFFFYKGFIYLCIGFFFFLLSKGIYNKLCALFLAICIGLTLTRGFILFTFLIFVYYVFLINKKIIPKLGVSIVGSVCLIILLPLLFTTLGDKSDSDSMRYLQFFEVINSINPISFIVGHGFGVGVESRPVHMELSFLEVFHKQGIIGICFWFGMFIYIFLMYYNIKNKIYRQLALPFLLSVIFLILQSATNPYLNNPIGLTMILITIVVFSKLLELQKNESE